MRAVGELEELLLSLDGNGYGAYKRIRGEWNHRGFVLRVDHVQGDPFATPTRVALLIPTSSTGLDSAHVATRSRRLGVAALLARTGSGVARDLSASQGSGRSGQIRLNHPGQVVREQTAVQVGEDGGLEARLTVGLPARGRRIMGRAAASLLTTGLQGLAERAFMSGALPAHELRQAALVNEDADALRQALAGSDLVAFVADGAILPRRTGTDDRPLVERQAVPFVSPPSLRVTLDTPHSGPVQGMGIARGVTLVAGGGFHGKSTLLRALEQGVWNHCPGDGRERVVARADAVKIRADDGRAVRGVDISPWIDGLPSGDDTRRFTTLNASGSTSQASALSEALEVGTSLLLVDEDTAATNFMIRDRRMQALVPAEGEPITPFVDRVRALHLELGVSTVLVIGGSGDYLDVADTVVVMDRYLPREETGRARDVAAAHPTGRLFHPPTALGPPRARVPLAGSVDTSRGRRGVHVRVRGPHRITLGPTELELGAVEQLTDAASTRSVAHALAELVGAMDGERTVADLLDAVRRRIDDVGLDAFTPGPFGDLAAFRDHELAAALNRLPTLDIA